MSLPLYSDRPDRISLTELVRELFTKLSELINTQITLTKTEIKVETRKMAVAIAFGGIAALLGFFTVLFLGVSLILLLSLSVGLAWASVITTGIYLALTGIFAAMMMKEVRKKTDRIDVD